MGRTSAALLRSRLAPVVALYVLARVPAAAVWLSVLLDVSTRSGSYARAGLAVAGYGMGVALVAPLLGRAADRYGARLVLGVCAVLQLPALLVVSAVADRPGLALLVPAFAAGAVQPPLVPVMRAGWAVLLLDEEDLQAAFTFDSVLGEVIDLLAPLLSVALNVLLARQGSLPVVAAAGAVTALAYTAVAPSREPPPARPPGRRSPVVSRQVLAVLVVIGLLTAGLGAVEVGAVAAADAVGHRSWAGLLLGLFTAGSIVGGLLQARLGQSAPDTHLLAGLLVPLCVGLLGAGALTGTVPLLTALLAVSGMAVAPLVAVLLQLLQAAARPGAETETFTYASTANFLGVSGGSALAGLVGDGGSRLAGLPGGSAGLLLAGVLVALAGSAVLALGPQLPHDDHRPSGRLCRLLERPGPVPVPAAEPSRAHRPRTTRRVRRRARRALGPVPVGAARR